MASASSNPAFANSPAFSQNATKVAELRRPPTPEEIDAMYGRPSAGPATTDRMTYEDTIVKIAISFGILLVGAVVGWIVPILFIPAGIIGFVLALVNIFKKQPSRGLVLAYAAVEGVFVGGVSRFYEGAYDGIVVQAVFGTLAVVGVTLVLFLNGKVRASKRATQVFLVAMVGYAAFSLVNLVLMWTNVTTTPFGLRDTQFLGMPLGFWLGILVVFMAAYSLVLDFTSIKTGVERGAPRVYGWQAAFGIMVTVVWLYLEILRLIAILRR